jgi:4-aminobutyrate aminotransferase-like enzyme
MSVAELKALGDQHLMPLTRYWPDDPLVVTHGKGAYLYDADGRPYLDMFGGVATVSVGYADPRVIEAQIAQLKRGCHFTELYLSEPIVRAAACLASITPEGFTKCKVVNSGSEANELAAMVVMHATGKTGLIALEHAYHGRTPIARSLTFLCNWRNAPPYVHDVHFVPNPYALRRPKGMGEDDFYHWCLERIETTIKHAHGGKKNFAGFWVEPWQGNGGVIAGPSWYYDALVWLVHHYDGLVVADEVQTGFGRTGKWFGCQWWNEKPDLIVMAKGIANGFPMGAVATTPKIAEAMEGFLDFNTFGGNPLAAVSMHATIDAIKTMRDNVLTRGKQLSDGLEGFVTRHRSVAKVRGCGLMLGVEFVADKDSLKHNPALMEKIHRMMRDRGVLVGKGGPEGNIMRIKPPYCLTEADCDKFLNALDESVTVAEAA